MEMFGPVESKRGLEDEPNIECMEVGQAGSCDLGEAISDLFGSILGGVDEGGSGTWDVESSEAGTTRSDGDSELESEPGFPALGLSPDDSDRAIAPELVDEPKRSVGSAFRHASGLNDCKRGAHRRRPEALDWERPRACGGAKSSK